MQTKRKFLKFWKLVQRENAARYIMISLLSSIATVTIVRGFLALTGYPQIGNATIHLAHVLWGGLILYIAAILTLIYLNPQLHMVGAILSGIGVGLFIDEVGKFITREYDYFFPAAAPIIYVFFLLVLILVIMINRPDEVDGRSELVQALETVREQLYRPLEASEKVRFEQEISKVMESDPNILHINLARYLLEFMRADVRIVPETSPVWWRKITLRLAILVLPEQRLSPLLIAGMTFLSLIMMISPLQVILERTMPESGILSFLYAYFGMPTIASYSPYLYNIRLGLELFIGALLLFSAILLALGKKNIATSLGYFSLLVSLAVLAMLLFYFEQFSAVLVVGLQFLVLFGVMYYRSKYLKSKV